MSETTVATHRDESFALTESRGRIRQDSHGENVWLKGDVLTPFGIVTVYSEGNARGGHSRYDFVHGGRLHIRTEGVERTQRGLAIMAMRFAREVARV